MPEAYVNSNTQLRAVPIELGGSYWFFVTVSGGIGYNVQEYSVTDPGFVEALAYAEAEAPAFAAWIRWHNFSVMVNPVAGQLKPLIFLACLKKYSGEIDGLLADIETAREHEPPMDVGSKMAKARKWAKEYKRFGEEAFKRKYCKPEPIPVPTERQSEAGYVYVLQSDSGFYKIGKAKDPEKRFTHFAVKLPMRVKPLLLIKADNYSKFEKQLHERFKDKRKDGEWFALHSWDIDALRKDYADRLEKIPKRKTG